MNQRTSESEEICIVAARKWLKWKKKWKMCIRDRQLQWLYPNIHNVIISKILIHFDNILCVCYVILNFTSLGNSKLVHFMQTHPWHFLSLVVSPHSYGFTVKYQTLLSAYLISTLNWHVYCNEESELELLALKTQAMLNCKNKNLSCFRIKRGIILRMKYAWQIEVLSCDLEIYKERYWDKYYWLQWNSIARYEEEVEWMYKKYIQKD